MSRYGRPLARRRRGVPMYATDAASKALRRRYRDALAILASEPHGSRLGVSEQLSLVAALVWPTDPCWGVPVPDDAYAEAVAIGRLLAAGVRPAGRGWELVRDVEAAA